MTEKTYGYTPTGALVAEDTVQVTERTLNGVHYLEVRKPCCDNQEILIMQHGLGGNMGDYLQYASFAADQDILVLLPEALSHGESNMLADFATIVRETAKSYDRLLDGYRTEDMQVSIIGISMGGMTGAYYAEHGTYPLRKLSMIISTPVFSSLENDIFHKTYRMGKETGTVDWNVVHRELADMEPDLGTIKGRGVSVSILQNGQDPYIPELAIESILDGIRYERGAGTGHTITEPEVKTKVQEIVTDFQNVRRRDNGK